MTTTGTPAVLRSELGVRGSWYADRACAQRAIEMALPAIEAAVARPEVSGGGFLSIVVVDPALAPGDCTFEEAILAEHPIGDRARWDADYGMVARAKGRHGGAPRRRRCSRIGCAWATSRCGAPCASTASSSE